MLSRERLPGCWRSLFGQARYNLAIREYLNSRRIAVRARIIRTDLIYSFARAEQPERFTSNISPG